MMVVKRRILVKGSQVHDVGYRPFLLEEAEALNIPYFSARNLKGEPQILEVLVGAEKNKIDEFVNFIEKYCPEEAQVDSISVEDYQDEIRTIEAFSRTLSTSQLSKIARTGVAMLNIQLETRDDIKEMKGDIKIIREKQDEHIGLTREMREKQDEHIGLTREMRGDIKAIREKQDEHVRVTKDGFGSVSKELSNFRELHEEIRELREDFNKLKDSVAEIEKKVSI